MGTNEEAKQWIIDAETACTPRGVPLSFTEVLSAKFVKKNIVVAEVKMFDGLLGTVEVSRHSKLAGWAIYWRILPGGAVEYDGSKWRRVPPTQMVLDLAI